MATNSINEVIYNWSFALYSLASEEKILNKINTEVDTLINVLKQNKEYLFYLNSYSYSSEFKNKLIDKAFSTFNKYLVNFIKLCIDANISKYLLVIFKKYREFANSELKIKKGIVYSITPLSDQEIRKLEKIISEKINFEVQLINIIDEQLLAGVKIKVEDYVLDNSIKSYLETFKHYEDNNGKE